MNEKSQAAEYNRLLQAIELQKIFLQSSSTKLNGRDIDVSKVLVAFDDSFGFTVSHNVFIVDYHLEFTGKMGKKKVCEIKCCYTAVFTSGEPVTDAFLERFSVSVVKYICLPYVREFVSNMTTRMDLPGFFMPLLKLSPAHK